MTEAKRKLGRKQVMTLAGTAVPWVVATAAMFIEKSTFAEWSTFTQWALLAFLGAVTVPPAVKDAMGK